MVPALQGKGVVARVTVNVMGARQQEAREAHRRGGPEPPEKVSLSSVRREGGRAHGKGVGSRPAATPEPSR